jgi:hypothetical protein
MRESTDANRRRVLFATPLNLDVDDRACRSAVERRIDFEGFWCRSPWHSDLVEPPTATSKNPRILSRARALARDRAPESERDVAVNATNEPLPLVWKYIRPRGTNHR